jgi:hypothetical protein
MMGFAPMKLRLLILAQRISERQLERSGDGTLWHLITLWQPLILDQLTCGFAWSWRRSMSRWANSSRQALCTGWRWARFNAVKSLKKYALPSYCAMPKLWRYPITSSKRQFPPFLLRIWLIVATSVKTYVEAMQSAESISVDENGLSTAQRVAVKVALFERAAVAVHVFAVIQHCRVSVLPL